MLALHKSLALAQSPVEKERLEKQIKSTDDGIDKLVYEMYGLGAEEIRTVELKSDVALSVSEGPLAWPVRFFALLRTTLRLVSSQ